MSSLDKNNIVYFDSECVLCGNFLKLLLRIDKKKKLRFASLQSEYSKGMLPAEFVKTADYKSVAFFKDGKLYFFSDAVVQAFSTIGFPWNSINVIKILPKKWRDKLYMKVSNNRYSWFGKSDQCILPTPELRMRFMHEFAIKQPEF